MHLRSKLVVPCEVPLQSRHNDNNPLVTGGFPSQGASNAENVSNRWRHHINSEFKCIIFKQVSVTDILNVFYKSALMWPRVITTSTLVQGGVSLTFCEHYKTFSWNLCNAEIELLMRISIWNFLPGSSLTPTGIKPLHGTMLRFMTHMATISQGNCNDVIMSTMAS